jgi:hypothetical protein
MDAQFCASDAQFLPLSSSPNDRALVLSGDCDLAALGLHPQRAFYAGYRGDNLRTN